MKRNIGIVGAGTISAYYAAAITNHAGSSLVAVCDTQPARLTPYAAEGIATYVSYEHFLQHPGLEIVIVTTPNATHASLILEALQAGKFIACEKPVVINLRELTRLQEISAASGVRFMGIYHRCYNKTLLRIQNELKNEHITDARFRYLEHITDHSGPSLWQTDITQSGGGCIIDNGVNCFDVLFRLVGKLTLTGGTVAYREGAKGAYDESAALDFTAQGGARISVELDWYYAGEEKTLHLQTASGKAFTVNFLAAWPGFKNSLKHEYEAALKDVLTTFETPSREDATTTLNVSLVDTLYRKFPPPYTKG